MTLTTTVSDVVQPKAVYPTTTYEVVTTGVAVGLAQVWQLNVLSIDNHVKVAAPVACRVTPCPTHIAVSGPALVRGGGFNWKYLFTVSVHPVLLMATTWMLSGFAFVYV